MKRALLPAALLIALAALCVRLGFWQLARLEQKRAINAARREALARPPVVCGPLPAPLERVRNRRVQVSGRYDETRQVLIPARSAGDAPGFHVITPLTLDVWGAVLVDRGWIEGGDAAGAPPRIDREPDEVTVTGLVDSIPEKTRGATWRALEADSVALWSTSWLALDSLKSRLPYVLATYVVRQLPGPGVPPRPRRTLPAPASEGLHLGYAIQWFLIAFILISGALVLIRPGGRPGGPAAGADSAGGSRAAVNR